MRIAIAFILFVLCAYAGCLRPQKLKKKLRLINTLTGDIRRLSEGMELKRAPIAELMRELEYTPLWSGVVRRLECCSMNTAWIRTVTELTESGEFVYFGAEELSILSEYGEVLGTGDMTAQVKNSELATKRLQVRMEETEAELKKKERVFRALGILGGAAAALLVI